MIKSNKLYKTTELYAMLDSIMFTSAYYNIPTCGDPIAGHSYTGHFHTPRWEMVRGFTVGLQNGVDRYLTDWKIRFTSRKGEPSYTAYFDNVVGLLKALQYKQSVSHMQAEVDKRMQW